MERKHSLKDLLQYYKEIENSPRRGKLKLHIPIENTIFHVFQEEILLGLGR
jgi:hypothetical protein